MDEIAKLVAEAKKELAEETSKRAKAKIATKLRQIEDAKRIVTNLELEYDVLLRDLRAGGV